MSSDPIREALLRFLYHKYVSARSTSGQGAKVSELKKWGKSVDYSNQDVMRALTYLKDAGWIVEEKVEEKFMLKNQLTTSTHPEYRISNVGIIHFEGLSRFTSSNNFQGINIANVNGVVVTGNNNYVHQENRDIYSEVEKLRQGVTTDASLTDEDKFEAIADIETIKAQLLKRSPEKSALQAAFDSLKDKLGKVARYSSLFNRAW